VRFDCHAHRRRLTALWPPGWPTASAGAGPACRSAPARSRRGEQPWTCASSTAPAPFADAASASLMTPAASAAACKPPTAPASTPTSRPASEPRTTPAAASARSRPAAPATAPGAASTAPRQGRLDRLPRGSRRQPDQGRAAPHQVRPLDDGRIVTRPPPSKASFTSSVTSRDQGFVAGRSPSQTPPRYQAPTNPCEA
jgi:hypothetical protein